MEAVLADDPRFFLLGQVVQPELDLPIRDLLALRLDREPLAIPRELDALGLAVAGLEAADLRARPGVEHLNTVLVHPHRDELTIRAEGDGMEAVSRLGP